MQRVAEAPVLPAHFIASYLKACAFGLDDLKRLHRTSERRVRLGIEFEVGRWHRDHAGIDYLENLFVREINVSNQSFDGMRVSIHNIHTGAPIERNAPRQADV